MKKLTIKLSIVCIAIIVASFVIPGQKVQAVTTAAAKKSVTAKKELVELYFENSTADMYTINIHNIETNEYDELYAGYGETNLGGEPSGTYDVTINPTSSSAYRTYTAGCNYQQSGTSFVNFTAIPLTATCNTMYAQ